MSSLARHALLALYVSIASGAALAHAQDEEELKLTPVEVRKVLDDHCVACHTSPRNLRARLRAKRAHPDAFLRLLAAAKARLDEDEDVVKKRVDIHRMIKKDLMPPVGEPRLTPEERGVLLAWAAEAAPP